MAAVFGDHGSGNANKSRSDSDLSASFLRPCFLRGITAFFVSSRGTNAHLPRVIPADLRRGRGPL
jgi:hypothetical protein